MNATELDTDRVAVGVTRMVSSALPVGAEVTVDAVRRVFGGNARTAWACQASWTTRSGQQGTEPLILLVRSATSQVQADPKWEYRILSTLEGQGVRAPRIWTQDPTGRTFGGAAVLLTRMEGSADPVAYLGADPAIGRARTLDLACAAAELHSASIRDLEVRPDPIGIALQGWRAQFESARLEPWPALSYLYDWLADRQPEPTRLSIVHGDFRPGNVLYEDSGITALLDWEMAHVGDGAEDLAWAYRGLWSPQRFVPLADFVRAYEEAVGWAVPAETLLWYQVFSEVKFATISLQAARSLVTGASTNLRLIDRARTVLPSVERGLCWITPKTDIVVRSHAGEVVAPC